MRFFVSFLLLLVVSSRVCAQQQDTVFAKAKDTTLYRLGFTGTGNFNKTAANGSTYIFNNAVRFNIEKRILTVNTHSSWIYGQNTTGKTNNDFLTVLDADLFKNTNQLYYWALGAYEKSFSLKIFDRYQVGAGLGFTVVDSKKINVVISDGLLYEKSALREVDKYGRNRYETVRNSFRLKNRLVISDLITVDGVHYLQNSLSDKEDYIIRTTNTVAFRFKKWLSFTIGLTYNKMNFIEAENLLFTYGIVMENTF